MYELPNHRSNRNSDMLCPVSNAGAETLQEETLTQDERRLADILKAVPKNTIPGAWFTNALDQGSAGVTRQLIREIKEQLAVSPEVMGKIIGDEAIEILKSL
jgi:hypothetical protein